ncbi:hypothetical protein MHN79_06570 [Vibrio sp. Of14-4]|uniref:hypothetical protein n=1 Tax=Vibrio sp. Of14-4 TaxID=2724878 RepID=UPI001EF358BF|nr:hypothetical protein [Vibrio sp. Of14-4]MCG7489147.1 hypothetical protein [Vibrio sp. Of14-4]
MSMFNSASVKQHIEEVFSEELKSIYEEHKKNGIRDGLSHSRSLVDEQLKEAQKELETLNISIDQKRNTLSRLEEQCTDDQRKQKIWTCFEQSLEKFSQTLINEKKILDTHLIHNTVTAFGGLFSQEVVSKALFSYALDKFDGQLISIEMSEELYELNRGVCTKNIAVKVSNELQVDEILVCLKHHDVRVSAQDIKLHIKENLLELVRAL